MQLFSYCPRDCYTAHVPMSAHDAPQLYLEDAYEMTGYVLDPGSPAALRGDGRQAQKRQLQKGAASQQGLLKVRVARVQRFLLVLMSFGVKQVP